MTVRNKIAPSLLWRFFGSAKFGETRYYFKLSYKGKKIFYNNIKFSIFI